MNKLDTPQKIKEAIQYSDTDLPALVKAIQPTVFREGESYYAVFGDELQKHVVGKGVSVETALQDWEKKLQNLLRSPGNSKEFARSVIITYMAYTYELSPPKTDVIINVVGLNLKDVEQYHLKKREPALIDRFYEILKRLGAEDDFLNVVQDMKKITPKFIEIINNKIALLKGQGQALDSIKLLTTGGISYEALFQSLDDWTLEWDKKQAEDLRPGD